jgi:hypothetical protein
MSPEINKGDIVVLSHGCSPGDTSRVPGAIGIVVEKRKDEVTVRFPPAASINVEEGNIAQLFPTQKLKHNRAKRRINFN